MIDYEVMKLEKGYAMQVNKVIYSVPDKLRHMTKNKMQALFERGEFKPLVKPEQ